MRCRFVTYKWFEHDVKINDGRSTQKLNRGTPVVKADKTDKREDERVASVVISVNVSQVQLQ